MTATSRTTESANGSTVAESAQDAAELVRTTAEKAAAKLPDVASTAQDAARDTQRRLDAMPNQALLVGTSFSIGAAAGLFIGGSNRLLVVLALAPAAAMALTMMNRGDAEASESRSSRTGRS